MNLQLTPQTPTMREFLNEPNSYTSILFLIAAIVVSYIGSRFVAKLIIKFAQIVATKSDASSTQEKQIRYRQIETYLSISIAVVRASLVAIVAYLVWIYIDLPSSSGAAAIGASAFFIVFAGQTLGMVLRDITSGAAMITEGWFHVGDFIKVEPFIDVSGVVERFTLRSTKLRSLNGEIVWVHNQQIQAVHVLPSGILTYTVDVYTRKPERAKKVIQETIDAIPSSAALTNKPMKIASSEEWNDGLWHIAVSGKVAPGRGWLIENFFINALLAHDKDKPKQHKLFMYPPTARFADPVAEKEFRRAIRLNRD